MAAPPIPPLPPAAAANDLGPPIEADPPTTIRCARCNAPNELGTRFCVSCGNLVGEKPRPQTSPVPAKPAPVFAPIPAGSPQAVAPIAPMPMVDLRPPEPEREKAKICARCRGASEPTAQFCKFCGAPFGDRPSSPGAKRSGAPGPLPGPPGRPGLVGIPPARPSSPAPAPAPTGSSPPAPRMTPQPSPSALTAEGPMLEARAPLPPGSTPMIPPSTDTSQYQGAGMIVPAKPRGRLVAITKDGGEGASYPIYDQLDVGRTEGEVVVPEDRYLSPRHVRIFHKLGPGGEEGLILRDLGSVNGVFLRLGNAMAGDGRVEVVLRDQDLFLVGQQVLKFEAVKDGEEGLGPASQHGTLLFGTPQAPRFARLCQRTVEGVTRDLFHIRKVETVLGRESGDIVFTDDPFLSRRHAVIKVDRENKRFLLADLGSSNGTFIRISGDVGLKSGDQFRAGQQLFRVELNRAET